MQTNELTIDHMRASGSGLLRTTRRTVLPLLLGLSLAGGALAGVVFEQSPVGGNDAFPSTSAAQSADDFLLSVKTDVSALTWWGSSSDSLANLPADIFRVRISKDDGSGHPAIVPWVEFTDAPTRSLASPLLTDVSGAEVFRYDLALPALTLEGGVRFYLSVVNEFDVGDPNAAWYWLLRDDNGANFFRAASTDAWTTDPTGDLSFAIDGKATPPGQSVPAPGTLALLLSGLGMMYVQSGRRRPACGTQATDNCRARTNE